MVFGEHHASSSERPPRVGTIAAEHGRPITPSMGAVLSVPVRAARGRRTGSRGPLLRAVCGFAASPRTQCAAAETATWPCSSPRAPRARRHRHGSSRRLDLNGAGTSGKAGRRRSRSRGPGSGGCRQPPPDLQFRRPAARRAPHRENDDRATRFVQVEVDVAVGPGHQHAAELGIPRGRPGCPRLRRVADQAKRLFELLVKQGGGCGSVLCPPPLPTPHVSPSSRGDPDLHRPARS